MASTKYKDWQPSKDTSVIQRVSSGTSSGAGADRCLLVGRFTPSSDGITRLARALLYPSVSYPSDAKQVDSVKLYIRRQTDEYHGSWGASPRLYVQMLTESLGSVGDGNAHGGDSWNQSGVHWDNQPNATATNQVDSGTMGTSHGGLEVLDITDLWEPYLPTSIKKRNGSPGGGSTFRGLRLKSFDEASTSRYVEIQSEEGSTNWYIRFTYKYNSTPTAPTSQTPEDGGSWASLSGTECKVTGHFNDADPTDYLYQMRCQVWAPFTTDAQANSGAGNKWQDQYFPSSPAGLNLPLDQRSYPNNTLDYSETTTDFPMGRTAGDTAPFAEIREQTMDSKQEWGAWSALRSVQIRTKPNVPTSLYFQNNPSAPVVYASLVSPLVADYITGARVEVYYDPAIGSSITMWASGDQDIGGTSNRLQLPYAGTSLEDKKSYRWRVALRNRDGEWSDFTTYQTVVMQSVTGPTGLSPINRETKINALTGPLTVADSNAFDRYRVWLYDSTGAQIYDTGDTVISSTTSTTFNIPAGLYNWGDKVFWAAAVRPTGNTALNPASPLYPIQFNSLPTAGTIGASI